MRLSGYKWLLVLLVVMIAINLLPMTASGGTSPDYLYTQLTDKFGYGTLSLNNKGHVLWEETVVYPEQKLWIYRNKSNTLVISQSHGRLYGPLNNNDQAAWWGYLCDNYFYNNGTITQMTFSQQDKTTPSPPKLNNNGQMVWLESLTDYYNRIDFFQNPGIIYFGYSNQHINSYPNFNNLGHVVWTQEVGSYYQVFLFDGSSVVQVTNDDIDKNNPKINDSGDIVWVQPGSDPNGLALVLRRNKVNTTITEKFDSGRNIFTS